MSYTFGLLLSVSKWLFGGWFCAVFISAFRFVNFQSLFIHFNDMADGRRLRGVYM